MADYRNHGLTITYVTDPELEVGEQKRVIQTLIQAASICRLRIAFRMPETGDEEIARLLGWYFNESGASNLAAPLVHNRPDLAMNFSGLQNWMPTRELAHGTRADVYSAHSRTEVLQAVSLGTTEVIYGHVFATESHPGEPGRGMDSLSDIASIAGISITAIGGIKDATIGEIGRAGISSVAMIQAISQSPNISKTVGSLKLNWEGNQT